MGHSVGLGTLSLPTFPPLFPLLLRQTSGAEVADTSRGHTGVVHEWEEGVRVGLREELCRHDRDQGHHDQLDRQCQPGPPCVFGPEGLWGYRRRGLVGYSAETSDGESL